MRKDAVRLPERQYAMLTGVVETYEYDPDRDKHLYPPGSVLPISLDRFGRVLIPKEIQERLERIEESQETILDMLEHLTNRLIGK